MDQNETLAALKALTDRAEQARIPTRTKEGSDLARTVSFRARILRIIERDCTVLTRGTNHPE